MNDDQLVDLLLDNYQKQYNLYKELLNHINFEIADKNPANINMGRIISILNKRNELFEEIKKIDDKIKPNKIGWDRRKNEITTLKAETLKTILKNIKQILSDVMVANKELEEYIQSVAAKVKNGS